MGDMDMEGVEGTVSVSVPAPFRTIAFAIDRSPYSAQAVTWGLKHILRQSDHVVLLHIKSRDTVPAVVDAALAKTTEEFNNQRLQHEADAEALVREYANEIRQKG